MHWNYTFASDRIKYDLEVVDASLLYEIGQGEGWPMLKDQIGASWVIAPWGELF